MQMRRQRVEPLHRHLKFRTALDRLPCANHTRRTTVRAHST
jgi:hypothetical protein